MKRSKLIFMICFIVLAVIIWRGCVYKPSPGVDAESQSAESIQADEVSADADSSATDAEKEEEGQRDREGRRPGRGRRGRGRRDSESRADDSPDPNQPAEDDDLLEAVNLNDVEMKKIIQTLGDWTGKPIIPTSDEVMKQKITIYSSEEIPRDKALSLIYAALRARGVIAEVTDDSIFLKPISQAKLGAVPTLGADDPLARIENKSQVVEKFFKLKNYSPTRLAEIITPLTAEYGHVTAIESTGNVAVIDTVSSLMRIEQIIKQLDVPESEQTVEEIFELKNADPGEVVQVLKLILTGGQSSSQRGRSSRGRRPTPQPAKPGEGTKLATSVVIETEEISATLIPMPRQGWIIARASAEDMKTIAEWIEKLDIEEAVKPEQTVVAVTYVDVREVARAVTRTIGEMPGTDLKANIVVEALPQSKQIVIFGSEENRKMVEKLIAEIDLPTLDIFKERTFKLKHADPDQIKQNIEGLYEGAAGSFSSYSYGRSSRSYRFSSVRPEDAVKVISYPTLKQVTVIASEANLKKIESQIKEWDVPIDIEQDQYRIISLKNSDPVQMVNLLSKLFTEEGADSSRSFMRFIFGFGDEDEKKKIVGTLYGALTFEAVPDTKKIIVISKIPEAYDVIEKLVKQLDSQEMAEVPRVITLKYADAEDLCDQLNAILNEPGTTATIRRSKRGLSVDTLSTAGSSGDSEGTQPSSDSGSTEIITPWWDRGTRTTDTKMPTSNLIGKIRFIPVHRSKAILVLAPPEYLEAITAMIEELDQPGKQVMIKAVIMEIDHSSMTSLGIQLSTNPAAFDMEESALGLLTELVNEETRGALTLTTTANVNVLIDLLVKKVNARILNQPTLWTKDNEEAVFVKGQNVAFIVGDQTDRSNPQAVTQQFDYRDVGVTLRVRPNITPKKDVDVTINLIISQVAVENVNEQLAINKLDTTTHVIVGDGETILLGGILFQKDSAIERKVPLLGDIPVLGELFKHSETVQRNNELLVFLTPYVIDEQTSAEAALQVEEPIDKMEAIIAGLKEIFEPNMPQEATD